MTRRDAAWLVTRIAATTAGSAFFHRWMQAAQSAHASHSAVPPDPHDWSSYQPKFFSPGEFHTLDLFTAILIPSDETPGAREAHVAAFTDFVVSAAAEYAPEMQAQWRQAMNWLSAENFSGLSPDAQISLVTQMSQPEKDVTKTHPGYSAYRLIKEMTVHAFYTSRAGLIDALEYKGLAYLTEFPACTHPEHQEA